MDTENELRAIRYLINDLILQVYDLRVKLEEIKPSKRTYNMREPNRDGSAVGFDLFQVPKVSYNNKVGYVMTKYLAEASAVITDKTKLQDALIVLNKLSAPIEITILVKQKLKELKNK